MKHASDRLRLQLGVAFYELQLRVGIVRSTKSERERVKEGERRVESKRERESV